MAFKLQAREQAFIGVGSIVGVVIVGVFGLVTDFAVMPSFNKFMEVQTKLTAINSTLQNNDTEINGLNSEMQALRSNPAQMPEGKNISEINTAEGQTLTIVKTSLLNTTIEMSQGENTNVLIAAKPLPPPPPPAQTSPDQPTISIGSVIQEAPYEIKLRGNYTSLNEFVNTLAAYDTVIEIQRLEITPESKDSRNNNDPSRPLEATFNINYLIKK